MCAVVYFRRLIRKSNFSSCEEICIHGFGVNAVGNNNKKNLREDIKKNMSFSGITTIFMNNLCKICLSHMYNCTTLC